MQSDVPQFDFHTSFTSLVYDWLTSYNNSCNNNSGYNCSETQIKHLLHHCIQNKICPIQNTYDRPYIHF